jgi:hypothetical protein
MRGTIVVAGSIAQKPRHGGHTWVFLQYLLGLRRLGWRVLFLDRLTPAMSVDADDVPCPPGRSLNERFFRRVMGTLGASVEWSLLGEDGEALLGLERRRILDRVREAELLVDVMGFLGDGEILDAARRSVFLDIDPGFPQMWKELGLADVFSGHDDFVTIGRNVGREGCSIPDCGLRWITTSQPIVLDRWCAQPPSDGPFTTIATWRGRYAPIEFHGDSYGLRVHRFRQFAELPRRTAGVGAAFELALDIDPGERRDLELLEENGWALVPPRRVAADPWSYQSYIARSGAEFMVAKDVYVRAWSGWFSDRSICYLASGRPVVVEDTGLAEHYPLGEGLLAFDTLDEAAEAVAEVAADRQRHARAARRVAEECFDSDKVLGGLLAQLGVEGP